MIFPFRSTWQPRPGMLCAFALVLLATAIFVEPVDAQSDSTEHWLVTWSASGRTDSVVRHVRIRWNADSLRGDMSAYERMSGTVQGAEVRLVSIGPGRPAHRVVATRINRGLIAGSWSSALQEPETSGTWRAVRLASAQTIAELTTGPFERWTISRPTFDGDSIPRHLHLRWKGDSLIGRIGPDSALLVGTVRDSTLQVLWLENSGFTLLFTGRILASGEIRGPFSPGNGPQRGEWRAKRDGPVRPGRLVEYAPTGSISHFTAANVPAVRVATGDTIRTRGLQIRAAPPLYVEGAYRGDILVVRILSVRPTPARAFMGTRLDPNWLTANLLRTMPDVPLGQAAWSLDTVAGVARLERSLPRLGTMSIPLRPHVGIVGVAPAENSVMAAGEEGAHGGNLDFSALGAGATLYLPVSHAGALLSVGGDVHAAQGDGELALNGLEANASIEFTVEVIEGRGLNWVRGEDARQLMAFGSSEDLNVALRLATTHLVQWLAADYGLDDREIAILLGAAVELEIANVFGSQRTIVALVPKSLLPKRIR